jgi:hypothetical protein
MVAGCDAKQPLRLRSLKDVVDKVNVTLSAANVCLKSSVQEETLVWYSLDSSECFEDPSLGYQYLEVEARIFQQCSDDQEWFVVVSTQDEQLSVDEAKVPSAGTYVDLIGMGHMYGFVV